MQEYSEPVSLFNCNYCQVGIRPALSQLSFCISQQTVLYEHSVAGKDKQGKVHKIHMQVPPNCHEFYKYSLKHVVLQYCSYIKINW